MVGVPLFGNTSDHTGISLVEQYTTVDKYLIAVSFDPKVFHNYVLTSDTDLRVKASCS